MPATIKLSLKIVTNSTFLASQLLGRLLYLNRANAARQPVVPKFRSYNCRYGEQPAREISSSAYILGRQ